MEWIRAANVEKYDVIGAFKKYSYIDWTKSGFSIKVNDVVYIYVSAPYSRIMYKTICVKDNVIGGEIFDDIEFWSNPKEFDRTKEHVRLEIVSEISSERLSLKTLNELKLIKARIQGAYKSERYPELFEYIHQNTGEDKVIDDGLENTIFIPNGTEGKKVLYFTTKYERIRHNREKAVEIHGCKCMICGFDFEKKYGEIGKGFIEVHHVKPLFSLDEEVEINPETDLVCICPNCHRMIHHRRGEIITPDELKYMLEAINEQI